MNFKELLKDLDSKQISTERQDLETYGKDWTKHFSPQPSAILFPENTTHVQNIVNWARRNKIAIVPSGGRTGLSAAACAVNGEVVLSLERMNKIINFDSREPSVRLQAGVITEDLQNFALEKGLYYPVDFAARGSSQIGGNIATNAGGIKVLRYGLTRNWVTSLQVVTGTGEILELNKGLIKNATGYDFRHLFIGSEGTLGVITEATIALTAQPRELQTVVLGVNSLDSIMEIFTTVRSKMSLMAYEMWTDLALTYVHERLQHPLPFATRTPYYVLIEYEKLSDQDEGLIVSLVEEFAEKNWIADATFSQSPQQAKNLWKLREDITEATSHKNPYKNDVSVRVAKVPEFLTQVDSMLKKEYPDFEVVWFGHIGDGNLHINILQPDGLSSTKFMERCHGVDEILFEAIEAFGGSVSAEHGVGLVKKPYLHHSRSPFELQAMKQIKKVFDPDGILNPGKIFD